MGDLIHRIGRVLFEGARPIDRTVLIVDALVLLIIFVEWIQAQRREHRISQRQKLVDTRLVSVRGAISQGQAIQHSAVPNGDAQTDHWYQRTKAWTTQTEKLLEGYSLRASTAFMDVSSANPMRTYQEFAVAQEYAHLVARLNNLIRIMENPEVYL
jgi:hypothetical protein